MHMFVLRVDSLYPLFERFLFLAGLEGLGKKKLQNEGPMQLEVYIMDLVFSWHELTRLREKEFRASNIDLGLILHPIRYRVCVIVSSKDSSGCGEALIHGCLLRILYFLTFL